MEHMPDSRRTELADFLRSRRERLSPEDVGLPAGGRRRTPGLRREEVALLAGVGVTWYTWLEQGRDINASVQVLEAIARTLHMDAQERWHLFQLAGVTLVPPGRECPGTSPALQRMLDQLDPFPAVVLSPRWDIVAYNRGYNWMGGDIDAIEPGERNQAWLFFTHEHWKSLCVRRGEAMTHMVGAMRMAMGQQLDDPLWPVLVQRLREASEEFDAIWRRHDVVDQALPAKDFRSPVGELRLESHRFGIGQSGVNRMMVYLPRDESTEARLSELVAWGESRRLRAG
jgi:transcriptional regulator with XRE-family HTH domain